MKVDYEKMEECKTKMLEKLNDMKTNSDNIKSLTSNAGTSEFWAGKSYDSFQKNQSDLLMLMDNDINNLITILDNITIAVSNFKQVDSAVQKQMAQFGNNP